MKRINKADDFKALKHYLAYYGDQSAIFDFSRFISYLIDGQPVDQNTLKHYYTRYQDMFESFGCYIAHQEIKYIFNQIADETDFDRIERCSRFGHQITNIIKETNIDNVVIYYSKSAECLKPATYHKINQMINKSNIDWSK